MGIHVIAGELTIDPVEGAAELNGEQEVRFAQPVRQVLAVLSEFSICPARGPNARLTGLQVSLGTTQQQIPSRATQVHGRLTWRSRPGSSHPFTGKVILTAVGIE